MAGGAGYCPGSGVDVEVVAVVAVFDAGFAHDGFDNRDMAFVVERFESRTGRVRRIGHDVGAGRFFGDKIGADVGVGGVGGSESHSSDEAAFGFGGYVSLVPVPFVGPGFVTVPGLGVYCRYCPVLGYPPGDPGPVPRPGP